MNRKKSTRVGRGPPLYQAAEAAQTCLGWGELQDGGNMPQGYGPLPGGRPSTQILLTDKEEPNPGKWPRRPQHPRPAQRDGHAGLLGQPLSFSRCCKTQAMLSANMENQDKMPTSEEYAHGDNIEKTQRGSPKRPHEPEETASEPMNRKLDFEVPNREVEW